MLNNILTNKEMQWISLNKYSPQFRLEINPKKYIRESHRNLQVETTSLLTWKIVINRKRLNHITKSTKISKQSLLA